MEYQSGIRTGIWKLVGIFHNGGIKKSPPTPLDNLRNFHFWVFHAKGMFATSRHKGLRSTPPSRGDRLILRSRSLADFWIRPIMEIQWNHWFSWFSTIFDLKINLSPRLRGVERKTFFLEIVNIPILSRETLRNSIFATVFEKLEMWLISH